MRASLAFAAAALAASIAAVPGGASAAICSPTVTGGASDEQQVVQRVLCLMPGTLIASVTLVDDPADDGTPQVALAIKVGAGEFPGTRGDWEGWVAASAIRDAFARRGFRPVVAFDTFGNTDVAQMYQINPRPPRQLNKGVVTWMQTHAGVDRLANKYGVRATLRRYNPYGKAPYLRLVTRDPAKLIDSGGLSAFLRLFRWNWGEGPDRYDGVYVEAVGPRGTFSVFTAAARGGVGCEKLGSFPHAGQVCPSP